MLEHLNASQVRQDESAGGRAGAVSTVLVAGALFIALAAWLVPWSPVPGGLGTLPEAGDLFTPAELARAETLARDLRAWSWSSLVVSLLFFVLVAVTRVGPRLMARLPGRWWVRVLLGVVLILSVERLLTLGFSVQVWRLRREYGLNTQELGPFLADLLRASAVSIVVTTTLVLVVVTLARRWPRSWVPVAAFLAAGLVVVGSFVYPVVMEPLFNEVTPLAPGELRTDIAALAEQEGVEVRDIVVADASRRTTTLNAWVSGLGATRRVVLYDNLVEEVPHDQVMVVVAHELAHARHRDVVVGTALGAAGAATAVGLLGWVLVRSGRRRGIRAGDVAVVPLVLALLAAGTQFAAPLQNGISRRIELRADLTALCLTQDPESFSEVQLALARRSLSDPTPPAWSQWWWGSHPGVLSRLAVAHQWDEMKLSRRCP